jgi:hypothetical protein
MELVDINHLLSTMNGYYHTLTTIYHIIYHLPLSVKARFGKYWAGNCWKDPWANPTNKLGYLRDIPW